MNKPGTADIRKAQFPAKGAKYKGETQRQMADTQRQTDNRHTDRQTHTEAVK